MHIYALKAAMAAAKAAPLPTQLHLVDEGLTITVCSGEEEYSYLFTWEQLVDYEDLSVLREIHRINWGLQQQRDSVLESSMGVRPEPRPPRRLP